MAGYVAKRPIRRAPGMPERVEGGPVRVRCEFVVNPTGRECGVQATAYVLARPAGSLGLVYGTEWRPFSACADHSQRIVRDLELDGMEVRPGTEVQPKR
jgi:hypothetical protein